MRQASADEIQYVYDSLNRLVEVRYPDKIIRYTYDDAGNRTGEQVITLNPVPALTSLDPNNATAGGSGFTLTVNGTNFVNGAVVNWNGAARTTAFVNDTHLTATIPAPDLAALGTASVTVFNPEPGGGTSNALPFAINAPASLQFSAATYSVTENGGAATITVTRSGNLSNAVTGTYATANGTATAGSDYTATSGTLSFAANEASRTFNVPITDDNLFEGNETVNLALSSPSNGALLGTPNTAVLTITDNETQPTLSINDVTVSEGNSGTTPATFTVSLSGPSAQSVTVQYATANGTATAGSDYVATSGTLTFTAGQTTQTITVMVNGDTLNEANETFFVNLSAPGNATLSDSQGVGTITNDDSGLPLLSVNDVSVTEGNTGTTAANFTVSLNTASGQTVTVNYATANSTAMAGTDYQAASGTLTFAPGETSKPVTVNVIGDTLDEDDETFFINLSNPTNADLGDAQGVGTILDDDASPTLSINNTTVTEGNSGTVTATLTVTLSAVSGRAVTVHYATADETATAGTDYQAAAGDLTFAPGQTSRPITIMVNGDTEVEADETFAVNLSNPVGATLNTATGRVTIPNDDASVQFSAASYLTNEGATAALITVQRNGFANAPFTIDYATADGTALQRTDYTATSGTLNFAANDTSKTFVVLLLDDFYTEPNESLSVALSNATGGVTPGATANAVLTIQDNDTAPQTERTLLAGPGGGQQVPPNNSPATGSGTAEVNAAATQVTVNLSFSGLSSVQTAAHIHGPAPVGTNAPVLFNLPNGTVTNHIITLTPAQVAQLRAGLFYFDVHTSNFPNGEIRGQILPNPLEDARFFVRQQYADFLSREPDAAGLDYWAGQVTNCGADEACLRTRRREVSNAFFFELEYQQTGAYVYRLYRVAFGNTQPFPNPNGNGGTPILAAHIPAYTRFASDRARVVGGTSLAQSQLALANEFVNRAEFLARYPANLSGAQFVDALLNGLQNDLGVNLFNQRDALIALHTSGGRGTVLYRLADDSATNPINNRPLIDAEYNRAFVVTQYFGYLRRDADLAGLNFWFGVVNQYPLRSLTGQLGMVCAFITSQEYQERFGPASPRSNSECP